MRMTRIVLAVAFLGIPAVALAGGIGIAFDGKADFSRYKSYAWGNSEVEGNPLVRERIISALDKQLAARGLEKTEGEADLQVVYHGSTRRTITVDSWGYEPGPAWGDRATGATTARSFKLGTLVVDLLEGTTKQLVWRGVAGDVLSDDPDKHEKKINQAVEKMFARFPPGARR